ncbi:uncharacterized protein LOC123904173 [Trifolium pratense]|uniref:Uncharacterized protein n=1 Tax=Trifolium pratense TaxID=57577 RepID=A0ACB0JSD7_TRIPR|nr:uncharacterized protein LOC123904173 [Trifolium pratense]CAJ2646368.1 unnamed protein product [Trifolium pratense]
MFALGWGKMDQAIDRWQWRLDPDTGYTVGGVYQLLTSQDSVTVDDADNLIWHSQVPLKVSIFAWLLLRDRLPTRANLVTRGVLSPMVATCVFGCGAAESAHHLFLSCSIAGSLWDLVRAWIGISLVDSTSLHDHFVQFTALSGKAASMFNLRNRISGFDHEYAPWFGSGYGATGVL